MQESKLPMYSKSSNEEKYILTKQEFDEFLELSSFFDFTPDLLCIAGFDAMFQKVNPAVFKLLGYSKEELFSKPINYFVHPDDQEKTDNARVGLFDGEPLLNFENRYITKSGDVVWLSWTSIPVKINNVIFAIAKDITKRKQQEEERNQLFQNISTINQELKHYARVTSHDLRTPVSNILSLFDLLDINKISDPETVELIKMLKYTTNQLHQTLESYLNDLIKNDANNLVLKEVDIEKALKQLQKSIDIILKDSGTIIKSDFSAFSKVKFNQTYLESILQNLLTNAIKYAHPDRLPIISMSTRILEGKKQLIISDNGSGFDLEHVKERVFKINETFHQNQDSKGLGLYLVHKHVTDLDGEIHLESKLNEGSTFIITFKD